MKLTPSYLVVENSVQWHPLKIAGATGKAWIKVFGRDPATQATADHNDFGVLLMHLVEQRQGI